MCRGFGMREGQRFEQVRIVSIEMRRMMMLMMMMMMIIIIIIIIILLLLLFK